jgi:hypothetical protein
MAGSTPFTPVFLRPYFNFYEASTSLLLLVEGAARGALRSTAQPPNNLLVYVGEASQRWLLVLRAFMKQPPSAVHI